MNLPFHEFTVSNTHLPSQTVNYRYARNNVPVRGESGGYKTPFTFPKLKATITAHWNDLDTWGQVLKIQAGLKFLTATKLTQMNQCDASYR